MKKKTLRIATRKSPLALMQANLIRKKLLLIYPNWSISLIPIMTYGDLYINKTLSSLGGKGIFLKELEIALLDNEADIAVHSMKDVPVNNNKDLCLTSVLKRENALDAFISNYYKSIENLPYGAKIGTSSLRRQCQLLAYRPDLNFIPLRGNIETRLKKLDDNKYDAIILSTAALHRLKLYNRITQIIPPEISLPSCGQGTLGVQFKAKNEISITAIKMLNDSNTNFTTIAERAFCKKLKSDCQLSIGSYAILNNNKLWLRGVIGLPDGSSLLKGEHVGSLKLAKKIGYSLAKKFIYNGAKKYLNYFNIN
ncbi:MAG: hydroxymethylbilane synthase [Buchnera aphidicola (Eriosoma harunire)]